MSDETHKTLDEICRIVREYTLMRIQEDAELRKIFSELNATIERQAAEMQAREASYMDALAAKSIRIDEQATLIESLQTEIARLRAGAMPEEVRNSIDVLVTFADGCVRDEHVDRVRRWIESQPTATDEKSRDWKGEVFAIASALGIEHVPCMGGTWPGELSAMLDRIKELNDSHCELIDRQVAEDEQLNKSQPTATDKARCPRCSGGNEQVYTSDRCKSCGEWFAISHKMVSPPREVGP